MPGIKNTITKMKNAFIRHIRGLNKAEERIPNWNAREKWRKINRVQHLRIWDNLQTCNIGITQIPEREERNEKKEIFEERVAVIKLSKSNDRNKDTEKRKLRETKQDK